MLCGDLSGKLTRFAEWQKLTQYCKATIHQLEKIKYLVAKHAQKNEA